MRNFLFLLIILNLTIGTAFSAETLERKKATYDTAAENARQISDSIQNKINSVSDVKRVLDEEANLATADYEAKNTALNETLKRIAENEQKLSEIEKNYKSSHKVLEKRVRDVYINGQISYVDVVFGAQDFGDFITRMDLLKRILIHDSELINSVLNDKAEVENLGRKLESDRKLQADQIEIAAKAKKIKLEKVAEQQDLIDKMQSNKEIFDKQYDEMMAASKEIERLIQENKYRLAARAAEQEQRRQAQKAKVQQEKKDRAQKKSKPVESQIPHEDEEPQIYVPAGNGAMIWPVSGPITSEFGWRDHPISGGQKFHSGIDIGADYGEPIHAAKSGVVIHAGWIDGYGNTVMIEHDNNIVTLYGHNQSLAVEVGQSVNQGQVVAYCGSTGNSTGPHCHFEVRLNGEPVSPYDYL